MCGITGYVGGGDAVGMALRNLHRLEYRGYDSAGVAFREPAGGVRVIRAQGKIRDLEARLHGRLAARAAVAHTRWATHGVPSESNAHPHVDCTGRVAVVHNGIVENHAELRTELRARGHAFTSETDTEVIAHLIEECLGGAGPVECDEFVAAVGRALRRVRGSYAVAIVSPDLGDRVLVARMDSPLIVGLGGEECYVASDIPAVMEHTRRVVALQNGDAGLVGAGTLRLFGIADGKPVDRPVLDVTWDDQAARKDGYEHYMLKEIHEGRRTVEGTLRGRLAEDNRICLAELDALFGGGLPERMAMVACGTAYHAGLVGKRMIESALRVPVAAEVASEFRYGDPLVDRGTLTVLISQSGETADTLAAMRQARSLGSPTLAIVNVVGSTLAREADAVLYTHAGPEIGVASTKAYLSQLTALALLAGDLGGRRGMAHVPAALAPALRALPAQVGAALDREADVIALAERLADHASFFFLGRGYDHAAALEAALKMKEISYLHSEAHAAGEMKHGPLALIERGVGIVGLCTQAATREKMLSNLQEARARMGTVIAVLPDGISAAECADHTLHVPAALDALMPVTAMVAMQFLAYHVARLRGCPIDQPRNLAKSVTVE